MHFLDNLVKIVFGLYYDEINVWREIPYPTDFNENNSIVIIQSMGTVSDKNVTFKLNYNKTQYCATSLDGWSLNSPYFIFIKK